MIARPIFNNRTFVKTKEADVPVFVKPKAPAAATVVPDGTYRAVLTGIRQFSNSFGERIGFEFSIKGGQFDGAKIMRSTAPQLSRQSKLAEVLVGLLGRELTVEELNLGLDLEQLVGAECSVLVLAAKAKNGATYSNVERVF